MRDRNYLTDDDMDIIASSLTLTIKSAEAYEENGDKLNPETRIAIEKAKMLLAKMEKEEY